MSNRHQQRLAKFDAILDKLLVSERARIKALHGDIPILVTAAQIIGLEHPQLSKMSKQAIRERILTHHHDIQTKPLFDEVKTAEELFNAPHPTLDDDARQAILSQVFATKTQASEPAQPNLSHDAKSAIFGKVRQAQQARQLDQMLISDEALAIAKRNPDPLIQAAVALVNTPAPALSQTARASIKEQLVPAPTTTHKPILRPVFAQWKQVAASVAVFIFFSLFALPVAAQDALPGDVLYPVKRTVERARLVVTASDNGRAQLYLNFANERIEEANRLMERGIYNPRLLDTALLNLETSSDFSTDDAMQSDISTIEASFDMLITDLQSAELLDDATAERYRSPDDDVVIIETPEPTPTIEAVVTPEPDAEIEDIASETPEVTEVVAPVDTVITTEEPAVITSSTVFYVNTNSRVNVRSQPTTSSAIVAQISGTDTVTQLGINADGTWYQVALATGEQGWVAATLLSSNADDAEQVRNSQAQSANGNNGNANGANNSNNGNANGSANGNANGANNGNNGANNSNPNDDADENRRNGNRP